MSWRTSYDLHELAVEVGPVAESGDFANHICGKFLVFQQKSFRFFDAECSAPCLEVYAFFCREIYVQDFPGSAKLLSNLFTALVIFAELLLLHPLVKSVLQFLEFGIGRFRDIFLAAFVFLLLVSSLE